MRDSDSRATTVTAVAGVIAALVLLAWINRFVQDDAFISFRYARNLVEGHGLVFNPGEPVEGYTNFLWTLMIAAGMAAGFEPIAWSYALGLAAFAGTLWITYRLATDLSGTAHAGIVALVLLGTNYSFSAYATGGLETQLQAFLVVGAVALSRAAAGRGPASSVVLLALASAAYGAALMTRLDSAVCLVIPGLFTLWLVAREERGAAARLARVAALGLPGTLLVAPWLVWKLQFYGDVLPNTYYVKVTSAASLVRGGHYVYRFFATYWLLPLMLVVVAAGSGKLVAVWRREDRPPWGAVLASATVVWFAYVASVGGDFMEFRFIVPVLPIVMVLVGWGIVELLEDRRLRVAVVVMLVAGSVFHAVTFWGVRDIESIDSLAIHMEPDGGDWDEVGRALGEHFEPGSGILVAVGPAGAIPYYSRLDTLDMRGLVDPWVARNGIVVSTVPGHQRMAPFRYLIDRGVHLVVGHPQVMRRDIRLPRAFPLISLEQLGLVDVGDEVVPDEARMLAIPMSDARWLLALYLTPHPAIDAAIASNGWPTVPLAPDVWPF